MFRHEWPAIIAELATSGEDPSAELAASHPNLLIVGLVGSIDNDFSGPDMTIGADSALHRITEAVDAITSTAASHQRTFIVKSNGPQLRLPGIVQRPGHRRGSGVDPRSAPGCG